MQKILKIFLNIIESEKDNLPLFIPVLFGLGIGIYFILKTEPDYILNTIILTIMSCAFLCSRLITEFNKKHEVLNLTIYKITIFIEYIFCALFIIAAGFFIAQSKAIFVKSPKIESDLGVIWLRGELVEMIPKHGYKRLVVKNNDLWQPETGKFKAADTPNIIRLNVRTKIADDVKEGDIISSKIVINPPALLPATPGGYDFARKAYFEQIGAVGFAISEVKVYKQRSTKIRTKINELRRKVSERIQEQIDSKNASAIISKLLVNISGGLDKDLENKIRETGLGHLLAISGLHMTIIMLWQFAFIRFVAGFSQRVALNYNIKAFAAIISLVTGLIYLVMCSFPISAMRSYIMVSVFLTAIFVNRDTTLKRPIGTAALLILIIYPEAIISPGFQMSFTAVIALVSLYNWLYRVNPSETRKNKGLIARLFIFFGELCLSTFVAGIITAPFAIYHFGTYPKFSILANMIAIPAVSIITMPSIFLAMVFAPLGLDIYFLKLGALGINIMIYAAEYLHSFLDDPVIRFATLPEWLLFIISLPLISLFILRNNLKYLLLPIVLYCIFIILKNEKPDILISENRDTIIYRNKNNYYYIGKRRSGFVYEQWLDTLAIKSINKDEECKITSCIKSNFTLTSKPEEKYCDKSLIINSGNDIFSCKNSNKVLNLKNFLGKGTILYYTNDDKILTSRGVSGYRIWNKH